LARPACALFMTGSSLVRAGQVSSVDYEAVG